MKHDTRLPSDAIVRLYPSMPSTGMPWHAVFIGRPPQEATPEAWAELMNPPGAVLACVTHEKTVTCPDKKGEGMVHAALDRGGLALLAFADLGDALAAKSRAERARR